MAEAPPGSGCIVSAEWDFDGAGSWPIRDAAADGSSDSIRSSATHRYEQPGTWFATFRAGVQREGDTKSELRRVVNQARVRVVVVP